MFLNSCVNYFGVVIKYKEFDITKFLCLLRISNLMNDTEITNKMQLIWYDNTDAVSNSSNQINIWISGEVVIITAKLHSAKF